MGYVQKQFNQQNISIKQHADGLAEQSERR